MDQGGSNIGEEGMESQSFRRWENAVQHRHVDSQKDQDSHRKGSCSQDTNMLQGRESRARKNDEVLLPRRYLYQSL